MIEVAMGKNRRALMRARMDREKCQCRSLVMQIHRMERARGA